MENFKCKELYVVVDLLVNYSSTVLAGLTLCSLTVTGNVCIKLQFLPRREQSP